MGNGYPHSDPVGIYFTPLDEWNVAAMEERRKLERFNLRLPAQIEITTPNLPNGAMLNLWTKDICSGGAFFATPEPLPAGTQVKIELTLHFEGLKNLKPNETRVNLSGTVVRPSSTGMAVRFDNGFEMTPRKRKRSETPTYTSAAL